MIILLHALGSSVDTWNYYSYWSEGHCWSNSTFHSSTASLIQIASPSFVMVSFSINETEEQMSIALLKNELACSDKNLGLFPFSGVPAFIDPELNRIAVSFHAATMIGL